MNDVVAVIIRNRKRKSSCATRRRKWWWVVVFGLVEPVIQFRKCVRLDTKKVPQVVAMAGAVDLVSHESAHVFVPFAILNQGTRKPHAAELSWSVIRLGHLDWQDT